MTEIAISGIGEVPVGRFKDRTPLDAALTVANEAIADAGIEREDLDAVLVAPCFADPMFNTDLGFARMVDELGLRGKVLMNAFVNSGGATGTSLLRLASGLIASGKAKSVLCLHTEKFSSLGGQGGFDFFAKAGIESEFEAPLGMVYNAIPALLTQRYLHERGDTIETVAQVAVSCREWASLHPCAMYRDPITVEDVLNAPMIAAPLTSLMLNALGDGGSAFVVTTGERARATTKTPVYVWGDGGIVNTYSFAQHDDMLSMNWNIAGNRAMAEARITPSDVDILEIYMAYPIFHLVLLSELGFCAREEVHDFIASGATRPGGSLPMSTNGDAMSYGHIGAGLGVANIVETCRQLMGKAGDRQVPGAQIVMETAAGGAYADAQVTIFGVEPR